jgi:hypothetical protein
VIHKACFLCKGAPITDELVTDLTNDTASTDQEAASYSGNTVRNTANNTADGTFAEKNNKEAFNRLLKKIRDSVITKRDYGTKLEPLVGS